MYEYSIEETSNVSSQVFIMNEKAKVGWRFVCALYNSLSGYYLMYFERPKQQ